MKLRLEMDDGRVFEAVGNERTMNCLADRIRFEKEFGVSAAVMEPWQTLVEEDENGETRVREGADVSILRESYMTFFAWCELRRRAGDVPDWPEVLEHVVELGVESNGAAPEDPTKTSS